MAQIANLVIADGATTPANKTFVPKNPQQGATPATWLEKTASNPLGYRKITALLSERSDGGSKVRLIIQDPVLATVNAACCVDGNSPKVSYTDYADITFNMPVGATIDNRKDILAFAKNLLALPLVTAMVVNGEPVW